MKLLFAFASVHPAVGGPVEGMKQLQEPLAKRGILVEVVCCDPPDANWLASFGCTVHALGPARLKYHFTSHLYPWLKTHITEFDAVVLNGLWQYDSFAIWYTLSRKNIPYFVFPHGMLDPWFKHAYPVKHIKKCLYWFLAGYRIMRDASSVLFTCEEERLLAKESFWPYVCREYVLGYGTTGPLKIHQEKQKECFFTLHPYLENKRIVLFLGRIHPKKGCDILIDAFASITLPEELHLVVVGPDSDNWVPHLQHRAEKLSISDRITWIGMLQGDAKWGALYAAEVFILPSHQENFGIAVVEALACGKPVLISNKVNIWREIASDKAGFVDEDTVAGTVRNVQRWLTLEKEEYSSMSSRAEACFSRRFHIERTAEHLAEVIQKSLPCSKETR